MQENLHLLDWFDFDIICNKVRICKTNWFPFMWLGLLLHLFPKIGWNLFWRSILGSTFHNLMHLCSHKTLLKPFLGILWKQRWINVGNASQELISTHYDIGNQCFSGFVLLVPARYQYRARLGQYIEHSTDLDYQMSHVKKKKDFCCQINNLTIIFWHISNLFQ